MVQVIARYWNGCWGNWNRRWVWLEYLGAGVYQVRWRGGDYADQDGRLRLRDSLAAVDALDKLLTTEVIGKWREIPVTSSPSVAARPVSAGTPRAGEAVARSTAAAPPGS